MKAIVKAIAIAKVIMKEKAIAIVVTAIIAIAK